MRRDDKIHDNLFAHGADFQAEISAACRFGWRLFRRQPRVHWKCYVVPCRGRSQATNGDNLAAIRCGVLTWVVPQSRLEADRGSAQPRSTSPRLCRLSIHYQDSRFPPKVCDWAVSWYFLVSIRYTCRNGFSHALVPTEMPSTDGGSSRQETSLPRVPHFAFSTP
jgi:hypothetical protein